MRIAKLMKDSGMPYNMVIEAVDGKCYMFRAAPFRKITEKDLTPLPYYQNKGKRAEEACSWMYAPYGLTKAE